MASGRRVIVSMSIKWMSGIILVGLADIKPQATKQIIASFHQNLGYCHRSDTTVLTIASPVISASVSIYLFILDVTSKYLPSTNMYTHTIRPDCVQK